MRRVLSAIFVKSRVAGRAAEAALVVLTLATLVFLALRILPGDPAALVLGDQASEAQRAELNAKLHLDEPMWMQYARFLFGQLRNRTR